MKKMTNKLRQNPEQYMNFIKSYIFIDILSYYGVINTIN